jgi:hypothetical protein
MSDHKYRRNGNIEWGGKGGGLKNAQKCIIVLRFMAKIVAATHSNNINNDLNF